MGIRKGLVIIGSLLSLSQASLALTVDETLKIWTEAYSQGYIDGYKNGVLKSKDFCFYVEGAKIFDDLLINGVIPPPRITAKWKQEDLGNGLGYKRILEVKFQPVSMEQLEQYKEFADYINKLLEEEDKELPTGYYYLVLENPLPTPYKGLLEWLVKKYIGKEYQVGVEKDGKFYLAKTTDLEDAKFIKNRLLELIGKFKGRIKAQISIEKL